MKKIVFIIITLTLSCQTQAQILDKLFNHAKDKAKQEAERRAQRRIDKGINKTYDEAEKEIDGKDKKDKKKRHRRQESSNTNANNSAGSGNAENGHTAQRRNVKTNKDFTPGDKVLYKDTFKNDAIGDFPVTWNTDSSAEVVTFEEDDTKWLQLDLGAYTPDAVKDIPENCTFEFDLSVSDNFDFYSDGLILNIISVKKRQKDFMQWQRFRAGKNGVRIRFKPKNFEYHGETGIQTYIDGDRIIEKKKNNDLFTLKNPTVHVGIWRQKTRLRVYLGGKKIWDIPRAFGKANYNAISFYTAGKEGEHFYLANLRLAIAGKDMRKALLETGKFVTNDIHFDVNKANIKSGSYKVLNELGKIMEENPGLSLEIIGHTDSDGSAATNLKLSRKRAEAIKKYLIGHFDIATSRLKTTGKGESEPVASNKTAKGKAQNRRVEFRKIN